MKRGREGEKEVGGGEGKVREGVRDEKCRVDKNQSISPGLN